MSWACVAFYLVERANYAPQKLLADGLMFFAAVRCRGTVFLRRLRERREEQGEASHLSREIREMPEPRDTGCHTRQPHRNLSVLCVKKGFVQRSKRTEESTN